VCHLYSSKSKDKAQFKFKNTPIYVVVCFMINNRLYRHQKLGD